VWASIVRDYQATPEKYIESFLWVKRCIERGAATFTSYVYKNPGGRRAGDEYVWLADFQAMGLTCLQTNVLHKRGRRQSVPVDRDEDPVQELGRSHW
jgi:hypothetical protein